MGELCLDRAQPLQLPRTLWLCQILCGSLPAARFCPEGIKVLYPALESPVQEGQGTIGAKPKGGTAS